MKETQQAMENKMMSLYEYLGKAAGSELGKAVAQAAIQAKVKIDSHEVSNSKYTGKILRYPKTFLDAYFNKKNNYANNINTTKTYL
jgi:hypothetical protein